MLDHVADFHGVDVPHALLELLLVGRLVDGHHAVRELVIQRRRDFLAGEKERGLGDGQTVDSLVVFVAAEEAIRELGAVGSVDVAPPRDEAHVPPAPREVGETLAEIPGAIHVEKSTLRGDAVQERGEILRGGDRALVRRVVAPEAQSLVRGRLRRREPRVVAWLLRTADEREDLRWPALEASLHRVVRSEVHVGAMLVQAVELFSHESVGGRLVRGSDDGRERLSLAPLSLFGDQLGAQVLERVARFDVLCDVVL
mmetsp:Transcript_9947/g.40347  ORF Transcript_9947/g.40347 Transcript_9947/m.40347 type:complete len:256 (+) Transcript_9947:986-1753(+)